MVLPIQALRKVYLDNLPRRGKLICWNKSIGFDIPFEYEDIKGTMQIVGVDKFKKSIILEYLGKEYTITTSRLIKNGISRILGVNYGRRKNDKYLIDEVVNNKKILNIIHKNKRTKYEFKCLNCKQINIQTKYNFENCGCPVCNKLIIIPEINGIKKMYPEVYNIIIDKDKDLYGSKSRHKVHWTCPCCKNLNYTSISHLTEAIDKKIPFPCIHCKRSFSIAESILYGVLQQTVGNFDHHIKFEWSDNKEYDAHVDGVIIEVHGLQHYKEIGGSWEKNILNQQKNDKYKEFLAKTFYKDLKAYVVIDCRFSDFNYIKNNIINSGLDKLLNFNFDDIDWEYIGSYIKECLYKKIGDMYNNGFLPQEISEKLGLSKTTVYKKLKFCDSIGMINFAKRSTTNHFKRKVKCKNTGDIFESCIDAALWCGLKSSSSIGSCCNNIKGFISAGRHPITNEKLQWEFVN